MGLLAGDPFDDLQHRLRDIWRALQEPVTGESRSGDMEIIEETDCLILTAEMLGVEREDIRVDVSPSRVVIQAPSPEGGPLKAAATQRSVALPAEVRPDEAEAHYNNGILEVVLPKRVTGGVGVHHLPAES